MNELWNIKVEHKTEGMAGITPPSNWISSIKVKTLEPTISILIDLLNHGAVEKIGIYMYRETINGEILENTALALTGDAEEVIDLVEGLKKLPKNNYKSKENNYDKNEV